MEVASGRVSGSDDAHQDQRDLWVHSTLRNQGHCSFRGLNAEDRACLAADGWLVALAAVAFALETSGVVPPLEALVLA